MPPQPQGSQNVEIEKALHEFELKLNQPSPGSTNGHPVNAVITSQNSQPTNHEVEGVKFETDKESYRAIKFYRETVEPKMVKSVIKLSSGVIKNQRQAEWVLLGFVVIAIAVSLYLVFGGVGNSKAKPLTNNQIEQIIKNQQSVQNP